MEEAEEALDAVGAWLTSKVGLYETVWVKARALLEEQEVHTVADLVELWRLGGLDLAFPKLLTRAKVERALKELVRDVALTLKEAGVGAGDRVVFLLPHAIEQMVWIEAA